MYVYPPSALTVTDITLLSAALAQNSTVVVEKTLTDCTLAGDTVTCPLTEEDTLALRTEYPVEIQLRVGIGDARLASQVFILSVSKILRDGALDG